MSDRPWLDRFLKRVMPNHTVIRRFVFGSWTLKIILVFGGLALINRVDANTHRSEKAVCFVTAYAENQAHTLRVKASPGAKVSTSVELEKLAKNMRSTGVKCAPPGPYSK